MHLLLEKKGIKQQSGTSKSENIEKPLHWPLHAAGYFLYPEYFYDNHSKIEQDEEVMTGLYKCTQRLVSNINQQDTIIEELKSYESEEGVFGLPMAVRPKYSLC